MSPHEPRNQPDAARNAPTAPEASASEETTKPMTRPMDLAEYIPDRPWPRVPEGTRLVRLGEENAATANELFNRVFGQERSLDHCRWKFWGAPAGPPVGYLCVEEGSGRPLAMSIGMRKQARVGGRDVAAILICESAADSSGSRGGRPFFAATSAAGVQAAREGIPFALGGQSTDGAIKIGRRWFGYRVVFALQVWMRRLSLRPALRARLGGAGEVLGSVADGLLGPRVAPRTGGLSVEEAGSFDARFDELWERHRDLYSVVLRRDAETLRWRYTDCPVGHHRVVLARRAGRPEGYLVWREWEDQGVLLATVLDLWDGRSEEVAAALLGAAERLAAREGGCEFFVYAAMPGSAGEAAVRRDRAFRPSAHHAPDRVIATPLPIPEEKVTGDDYEVMRRIIDGRNWYYTQGDCDFRD